MFGRKPVVAAALLVTVVGSAGAAVADAATSKATVKRYMRRTVEVNDPSTHFRRVGGRVTVGDGNGGTLTAAIGQRTPTADGHGQLVFFFHGGKFLGWDSKYEISSIRSIEAAGSRRFDVTYVRYRSSDPSCCPSLSPKTVRYRWSGSQIQPLGTRPVDPVPNQVEVRLRD